MTDHRLAAGKGRVVQQRPVSDRHWTKAAREIFLRALVETCNVQLSCARAERSATGAYALRRRDPVFAGLWLEALTIGYERLEAALLRHALTNLNDIAVGDATTATLVAQEGAEAERNGAEEACSTESGASEADGKSKVANDVMGAAPPQPGSGFAPIRLAPTDVQLSMLLLNRHRATIEGGKPMHRPTRRATPAETDAALRRALDGLARRLGGGGAEQKT